MSNRVIQTEEIQSLNGVILAKTLSRFAISDTLVLDDLTGNQCVTKNMLLGYVPSAIPTLITYPAGSSINQTINLTDAPGHGVTSRLMYEQSQASGFNKDVMPFGIVNRYNSSGVFLGWFITLIDDGSGTGVTGLDGVITIIG